MSKYITRTLVTGALALTIILFFSSKSFAQTDSTQVQVETNDGNEFIGTITYQDNEKIKLVTIKFGELTLKRVDIVRITPIVTQQLKAGVYWFENPQATRYFWSANGYGLKKGEGYYQNVWVLFNQVSVGITDNISFGAGLVPLFLFGGTATPVWVTPKVSIPVQKDKFNLGIGALLGATLGEEGTSFGLLYGISTFGSRDKNFSIGIGYGYADGELADRPTLSFSSMIRTGQRSYFMTENYYIGTGDEALILLSLGGRRIIKKAGLDFGLFIPFTTEQDTFIAIPWLGLTLPFGNVTQANKR
ncbi:MAG: hypothetical protein JNM57_09235 [Cyclobacteriaceae bacterium]|nr:hypothetical protein [Cyclobacteriaceae bacterium]